MAQEDKITAVLNFDVSNAVKNIGKVKGSLDGVDKNLSKLNVATKAFLGGWGATEAVNMMKNLGKAFNEVNTQSKLFGRIFGRSISLANKGVRDLRKEFGKTTNEAKKLMNQIGNKISPQFSSDMITKMSADLSKVALNVSKVFDDMGIDQITQKLAQSMSGEFEGLRDIGIIVDKTTDRFTQMVEKTQQMYGFTRKAAEAMEIYREIMRQSVKYEGFYSDGINQLVHQFNEIKEIVTDEIFVESAKQVASVVTPVIKKMKEFMEIPVIPKITSWIVTATLLILTIKGAYESLSFVFNIAKGEIGKAFSLISSLVPPLEKVEKATADIATGADEAAASTKKYNKSTKDTSVLLTDAINSLSKGVNTFVRRLEVLDTNLNVTSRSIVKLANVFPKSEDPTKFFGINMSKYGIALKKFRSFFNILSRDMNKELTYWNKNTATLTEMGLKESMDSLKDLIDKDFRDNVAKLSGGSIDKSYNGMKKIFKKFEQFKELIKDADDAANPATVRGLSTRYKNIQNSFKELTEFNETALKDLDFTSKQVKRITDAFEDYFNAYGPEETAKKYSLTVKKAEKMMKSIYEVKGLNPDGSPLNELDKMSQEMGQTFEEMASTLDSSMNKASESIEKSATLNGIKIARAYDLSGKEVTKTAEELAAVIASSTRTNTLKIDQAVLESLGRSAATNEKQKLSIRSFFSTIKLGGEKIAATLKKAGAKIHEGIALFNKKFAEEAAKRDTMDKAAKEGAGIGAKYGAAIKLSVFSSLGFALTSLRKEDFDDTSKMMQKLTAGVLEGISTAAATVIIPSILNGILAGIMKIAASAAALKSIIAGSAFLAKIVAAVSASVVTIPLLVVSGVVAALSAALFAYAYSDEIKSTSDKICAWIKKVVIDEFVHNFLARLWNIVSKGTFKTNKEIEKAKIQEIKGIKEHLEQQLNMYDAVSKDINDYFSEANKKTKTLSEELASKEEDMKKLKGTIDRLNQSAKMMSDVTRYVVSGDDVLNKTSSVYFHKHDILSKNSKELTRLLNEYKKLASEKAEIEKKFNEEQYKSALESIQNAHDSKIRVQETMNRLKELAGTLTNADSVKLFNEKISKLNEEIKLIENSQDVDKVEKIKSRYEEIKDLEMEKASLEFKALDKEKSLIEEMNDDIFEYMKKVMNFSERGVDGIDANSLEGYKYLTSSVQDTAFLDDTLKLQNNMIDNYETKKMSIYDKSLKVLNAINDNIDKIVNKEPISISVE